MFTLIIIITLIVIYFLIAGMKENEARETIQRERKVSDQKIVELHYQNQIKSEVIKKEMINELKRNFAKELEKENFISNVYFEENTLNIKTIGNINMFDADDYANYWINSLIPSTEIDKINIYGEDGILIASASRFDSD